MNHFNLFVIWFVCSNFTFVFGESENLYANMKKQCPKPDSSNLDATAKLQDKTCEAKLINSTSLVATYIISPKGIQTLEEVDKVTGSVLKAFLMKNIAVDCLLKDCSTLYTQNRYECLGNAGGDIRIGQIFLNSIFGFIDTICDEEIQNDLTTAIDETPDVCINELFNLKSHMQRVQPTNLTSCSENLGFAAWFLIHGVSFQGIRNHYETLIIENCISSAIRQLCGEGNETAFSSFFKKLIPKVFDSVPHDQKWEVFHKEGKSNPDE